MGKFWKEPQESLAKTSCAFEDKVGLILGSQLIFSSFLFFISFEDTQSWPNEHGKPRTAFTSRSDRNWQCIAKLCFFRILFGRTLLFEDQRLPSSDSNLVLQTVK